MSEQTRISILEDKVETLYKRQLKMETDIETILQNGYKSYLNSRKSTLGELHKSTVKRLLSSEKARYEYAIELTDTYREAAKLIGVTERTFYRKIKKFKIKRKLVLVKTPH